MGIGILVEGIIYPTCIANKMCMTCLCVDCREREITFELGVKALDMTSLGIQLLIVCSVMRMRKSMIKYAFPISLSVRKLPRRSI